MRNKALGLGIAVVVVLFVITSPAFGQSSPRTIHAFVALADNDHQGIVPVPPQLGNGNDPRNNLYWGALYGIKAFFKRSDDWTLVSTIRRQGDTVLERCVFKHRTDDVYLVADAYRGSDIAETVMDFLAAASGNNQDSMSFETESQRVTLAIGGSANLVVYVGHNGLMDFQPEEYPGKNDDTKRDTIILACLSKSYFSTPLRQSGANPILWTTGLMAPEAYTLKSAIDGWILGESGEEIRLRAAQAYHKYQQCGLRAARRLFTTGW